MSPTFDPSKNAANLRKHGVSLSDGDGVLNDPLALTEQHLESDDMRKEYDFSKAKRGAVVSTKRKTRITIFLDDAIVARFKELSEQSGTGYQTLINDALNAHLGLKDGPITRELVRKIVREELASQ